MGSPPATSCYPRLGSCYLERCGHGSIIVRELLDAGVVKSHADAIFLGVFKPRNSARFATTDSDGAQDSSVGIQMVA
jgi:hypothetical protein